MSQFTQYSPINAPEASKPLLQKAQQQIGFIPNLLAIMAASPAALESYLDLTALFDKTAFSAIERQFLLLTISRQRDCCYCLAAHSTVAKMQHAPDAVIEAVYYKQAVDDERLEALRTFALTVLDKQGLVDDAALHAFYQAGFKQQQALEVVLAISFKTLSNFTSHLTNAPIDKPFLAGLPDNADSCLQQAVLLICLD